VNTPPPKALTISVSVKVREQPDRHVRVTFHVPGKRVWAAPLVDAETGQNGSEKTETTTATSANPRSMRILLMSGVFSMGFLNLS
jgi:hypothetical protein